MTIRYNLFCTLACLFIVCNLNAQDELYKNLEFDMPKVKQPVFPDYKVSIEDFKGIGDGMTDNTNAFSESISHVVAKGGGQVIIPRGIWKTGPIELKSNINLHVEEGALIIFSDDKSKYPLVKTSFE